MNLKYIIVFFSFIIFIILLFLFSLNVIYKDVSVGIDALFVGVIYSTENENQICYKKSIELSKRISSNNYTTHIVSGYVGESNTKYIIVETDDYDGKINSIPEIKNLNYSAHSWIYIEELELYIESTNGDTISKENIINLEDYYASK